MSQCSFICTQLYGFKCCLHTVKLFQVLLINAKRFYSILIIPCKRYMNSIQLIHGTLICTHTPGQSELERNGIKGVLHIPQSSRTGTSSSVFLGSYPAESWVGGLAFFQRIRDFVPQIDYTISKKKIHLVF